MNHENIMLNERKTGRWEKNKCCLNLFRWNNANENIYKEKIRWLDVNTFECKRKSKNFPVGT